MPLSISTIIPAYNAAEFLAESISSVLSQTRKVNQIIVVDDCSTDDTAQIAKSFASVTYLKTSTNAGHAAARNLAINKVEADLIAWLDADDTWAQDHLEKVAGLLDKFPKAAVACSPVSMTGARTGIRGCIETGGVPINAVEQCFRGTCVPAMSAVTRTNPVREVNGFDDSYRTAPDFDFWLRMSLKHPFVSIDSPTANYRWHAHQISAQSKGVQVSIRQRESIYRARHEFCAGILPGCKQIDIDKFRDLQHQLFMEDIVKVRKNYEREDQLKFFDFSKRYMPKSSVSNFRAKLLKNAPLAAVRAYSLSKRLVARFSNSKSS